MRFSICLPATRAIVTATIASIEAQTAGDWELLVVGQGDDTEVRGAVSARADAAGRIRYIHIAQRTSSAARNAALRAASGEVIAMLDDDCEAAPDWLQVIDECLAEDESVGLVGGSLVAPPRARRGPGSCPEVLPSDSLYDPVRDGRRAPDGWVWVTANAAFRRDALETVGLFDELLGPGTPFPGCEDTDFRLRFERAGVRMRTTPRSVVRHTHGWRYGIRAVLRHQRNYARGNGAMAAKLTLMDDGRGREWVDDMRADCLGRWHRTRDVVQLPSGLRRWRHFSGAYRECVRGYRVDARGFLEPVEGAGSPLLRQAS